MLGEVQPGDGFQPDERLRLQEGGTSLAGRIAIGSAAAPALFRRAVGRLWPEIVEDSNLRLAVDGYLVHDGKFLIGGADEARDVARAFRARPDAFLAGIDNGCCNIVAHDHDRKITVIANDPTGCLPLYIHVGRDAITFANDFPGLQAISPRLERDPLGCAELYWFGYQIGNRTIFRDIYRTPPGSILTIDWRDGRITTETWASPAPQPAPAGPDELCEVAADLVAAMRTACHRLYTPERRYGIKLSGGMDSRLIAGSWQDPGLRAFTYAAPDTIEERITGRLARALAIPLQTVIVEGDFFSSLHAPLYPKHALAEFFHQALTPRMREAGIDCALDGLAGDVLFGGLALKRKGGLRATVRNVFGMAGPSLGPDVSNEGAAEIIFNQIRVPDGTLPALTAEARRAIEALKPAALDDIAREFPNCEPGLPFDRRYIRFAIRNRMRRDVALQGGVCRPDVETIYPFLDRDVQAVAARISSAQAAGKRFYRRLYREQLPRIARVPLDDSLLPPGAPNAAQVIARILRYGLETSSFRASLISGRNLRFGRVNAVQWPRWIAFDRAFIAGLRRFMQSADAFDAAGFDAAIERARRGQPLGGSRIMLTASFCGLDKIVGKSAT
ncbi:asparagine synthase-related protein [Dongia sp.]|uniref:asparagine synthase-related protein n=1 Tax=Dongia sp. TaxID=1977262 RepID=UPI0037530B9F